jgi:hydroxypyruvate reductase
MITEMNAFSFGTHSLQDARVLRILTAALDAVEPGAAVKKSLAQNPLPQAERTFGLAVGKASLPMLDALTGLMPLESGLAIPKHASSLRPKLYSIMEGGHPVPDERSLAAGQAALKFVSRLTPDDLLVCLISGGGSALMTAPRIPLADLRSLTSALLACGARIDEINSLRRHLDQVKGGGLVRAANGARVISLIISDVVGNPLEAIASGPTAPDPSTCADARAILQKYKLNVPDSIMSAFEETLKPGDELFSRVENRIIASNEIAVRAALTQAEREGFHAQLLTTSLQGEAREVGVELVDKLRKSFERLHGQSASMQTSEVFIAGGETTVTLRGSGKGGRNQELALAAVPVLAGLENVMLISLATDGEDGPTDAAGAVVTGESADRAESLGLSGPASQSRNDAYPFFAGLDDLIRIGPTGTNVNDIVLLLCLAEGRLLSRSISNTENTDPSVAQNAPSG